MWMSWNGEYWKMDKNQQNIGKAGLEGKKMILCDALEKLRDVLPPIFAGTSLDQLTGNAYRWRSLQNERCRGDAPKEMFLKSGSRKTLVDRDRFLEFWQDKIESA